jgi:hypothetical protein
MPAWADAGPHLPAVPFGAGFFPHDVIVRDNLVTFCIQDGRGAGGSGTRTGAEMITIRYADLPEGLHARAEAHGRRTFIYLRPGLTAEQRRLSLRRARQSARMGYGPRLPGPGLALAVARHIAAGTLRNLGAAVRRHPLGFLFLSAGFTALMVCYALFVTVSIRLMLNPAQAPAVAQAAARGPHPARVVRSAAAHRQGGGAGPGPARPAPVHLWDHRAWHRHPHAAHRASPGPSPTAEASPSPSPAATASPSPSVCVTVGPIGVCL